MAKKRIPKISQKMLWEEVHKAEKSKLQSTELMKKVAEKAPSRKKIAQDFSPAEQAEIFKRINADKSGVKLKEKVNIQETAERRALIRKVKKLAKEMESYNNSRVILFPSYSRNSDKLVWYKLADFSALYYKYRMAERMGRESPRLHKDKDRFYRMKQIASIGNIDKFITDAMKLDEFERHEETIDKVHILYLKTPLTDNEVALLEKTGEIQKEMMHNVLRPKKAAPEVYLTILMLGRQVMKMVHKLEVIYRYEIGDSVARQVGELLALYFDYTQRYIETETARRMMQQRLFRIRAGMALLGDGDAVKPTDACAIGETIAKIESLLGGME